MNAIPDCEAQQLLHRLTRAVNVHARELAHNFCARSRLFLRQIGDEEMMKAFIESLPPLLHRHWLAVILIPCSAILRPALDFVRTADVVPRESRPVGRAKILEYVGR